MGRDRSILPGSILQRQHLDMRLYLSKLLLLTCVTFVELATVSGANAVTGESPALRRSAVCDSLLEARPTEPLSVWDPKLLVTAFLAQVSPQHHGALRLSLQIQQETFAKFQTAAGFISEGLKNRLKRRLFKLLRYAAVGTVLLLVAVTLFYGLSKLIGGGAEIPEVEPSDESDGDTPAKEEAVDGREHPASGQDSYLVETVEEHPKTPQLDARTDIQTEPPSSGYYATTSAVKNGDLVALEDGDRAREPDDTRQRDDAPDGGNVPDAIAPEVPQPPRVDADSRGEIVLTEPVDEIRATKDAAQLARIDIIEALILELRDPNPVKRSKAIWELGQRADSRSVQPLVNLLLDSDSRQRGLILAALSEIGSRTLQPMNRALAIALQDDKPEVRKNAIRDLIRVYDLLAQIGQLLRHTLNDPDGEVREVAQWALNQLERIHQMASATRPPYYDSVRSAETYIPAPIQPLVNLLLFEGEITLQNAADYTGYSQEVLIEMLAPLVRKGVLEKFDSEAGLGYRLWRGDRR